jgi:hypothetical protein
VQLNIKQKEGIIRRRNVKLQKGGLRGGKPRQGMDSPLIFKYFFFSFSDASDATLRLDWGLNGTVEGASSISLQGTRARL